MVLLQQMFILFILMGIGYFCGKKGFMDDEFSKNLSWIVVNVATPGMILHAGMDSAGSIKGKDLAFGFGMTVVIYAFLAVCSFIILPLCRTPKKDIGIYRTMTLLGNIGFMGLPILSAAYGSEAVLYGALFQFLYNLIIYTYGIAAMRGENPFKSSEINWKNMLNVGVVSSLVAVIFYIAGVRFPDFVISTAGHLKNLAAPLSMMVIGQSMVKIKMKDMFGDLRLLAFSLIRLIIVPIVGIFILRFFVTDFIILRVCYIMLAVPIGAMTAMMAQQYDGNYTLASKGVALSTILSVITIPLGSFLLFSL